MHLLALTLVPAVVAQPTKTLETKCAPEIVRVDGNRIWARKRGNGRLTAVFEAGFGNESTVGNTVEPVGQSGLPRPSRMPVSGDWGCCTRYGLAPDPTRCRAPRRTRPSETPCQQADVQVGIFLQYSPPDRMGFVRAVLEGAA